MALSLMLCAGWVSSGRATLAAKAYDSAWVLACVAASQGWCSMVRLTIDVPEGALAGLHKDPQAFARELRLAAAVKWYELKLVSQGRAAEIAGLSRREFIDALGRFGVTPFQYGADEIIREARGG